MAKAGERFLKGLVSAGRGISGAYVQALIDQERQEEEEREATRQQRMDELSRRNIESQITAREEPAEEPTPKGFALSAGQARYEWDPEAASFAEVAKLPGKEEKPEKPEYTSEDIAKMRAGAFDDARAILNKQRGQDLDFFQEMDNREAKKTAEKEGKTLKGEELPNPVGEPPTFQEVSALADSTLFDIAGIPAEMISDLVGNNQGIADYLNAMAKGEAVPVKKKAESKEEEPEFNTSQEVEMYVKAHPEYKWLLETPEYKQMKEKEK